MGYTQVFNGATLAYAAFVSLPQARDSGFEWYPDRMPLM